eukprot:6629629-Pyramimonas_sp.AAC.2
MDYGKVPRLAWELRSNLSADRLDFEVNMAVHTFSPHSIQYEQRATRVRARPRAMSLELPAVGKSPCWLGN